ncbi:MAG: DMT family transporter [Caldilineaceae bacterium]
MQKIAAVEQPTTLQANQIGLLTLLICFESLHFVFAKLLEDQNLPATFAAAMVLSASALEMGIFGWWTKRITWAGLRRNFWFFVAIGFFVGASTMLSYESVRYISPGIASVLSKTTTLFNLLFGIILLHERLTLGQQLGGAVAILGAVIIVFEPGDYLRLGSLIVVTSSLLYAFHALTVKRWGGKLDFVEFFFYRVLFSSLFLLSFAASRQQWAWPPLTTWLMMLLVGTIDVTLSRTVYYMTMRKMPLSVHSIVLTLSPVGSILLTFLLFQTVPTLQQAIGGVLVLLGVLLVTLRRG